jgi:hypothetical protein
MNSRLFLAVICTLVMVLWSALAFGQDAAPSDPLESDTAAEPEQTWRDYSIKAYTIEIFGGMFGGDTYLDLPVKGDRTYVEPESDRIMSFDGEWFQDDELDRERYDGPVKTMEDGYTIGVKVGSYLSDHFHLDLVFSYSASEAVLMLTDKTPDGGGPPTQVEWDRDGSVQIFRGALEMMYDFDNYRLLGIYPYLGFGFGGVINRFSALEDVSGLFLVGTGGLRREIAGNASAFVQFDYTNFSMDRHELNYTKSVSYTDITFGISFFIDVVPPDIRALHDADVAEARRQR